MCLSEKDVKFLNSQEMKVDQDHLEDALKFVVYVRVIVKNEAWSRAKGNVSTLMFKSGESGVSEQEKEAGETQNQGRLLGYKMSVDVSWVQYSGRVTTFGWHHSLPKYLKLSSSETLRQFQLDQKEVKTHEKLQEGSTNNEYICGAQLLVDHRA
ncbi:hypothetical protein E3N88_45280 [Mikania micrantha]|uniref:Uncharacterized protein n=1 Tax=Mikania micrantha TaxID=192012 RepID=A0A5N6L9P9_9ASTR|nr:hypothetical protein E3N88_45280 [Mikania micrantha]